MRWRAEEKHGMCRTLTYEVWASMIQRCTNPRNKKWVDYGGRGITVCNRWRGSFVAFFNDMGAKPQGLTLERRENDKGYEPGNCVWATYTEQASNRRDRSDSSTGVPGISWRSNRRLYDVRVTRNGRRIHVGATSDFTEACWFLTEALYARI